MQLFAQFVSRGYRVPKVFLFLLFQWQFVLNGINCQQIDVNSKLCDLSRNKRRRSLLQNNVNLQSADEFVFYLGIQLFDTFQNSTQQYQCKTNPTNTIKNNTMQLMNQRDSLSLKEITNISEIYVNNQGILDVVFDYTLFDNNNIEYTTKIYGVIDQNIDILIQQVCVKQSYNVTVQFESSIDLCQSQGICFFELQLEEINQKFNYTSDDEENINFQFNQLANGLSACDVPNSSCKLGCSKPAPQESSSQNLLLQKQKSYYILEPEQELEIENLEQNYDPLLLLQEDIYYENLYNGNETQNDFAPLIFMQPVAETQNGFDIFKVSQQDDKQNLNFSKNQFSIDEYVYNNSLLEDDYRENIDDDSGSNQILVPDEGDQGRSVEISFLLIVFFSIVCYLFFFTC